MRHITFAILFLLSGTAAAFASCESMTCEMIGGSTRNGVCLIPKSVYDQATAWQVTKAKACAIARGIRWRVVKN